MFISWSGDKSKAVAGAVSWWLGQVLQHATPWVSTADVTAGDRWAAEIAKGLDGAAFGIICVTPENQSAAWLNYEAGAISKEVNGEKSKVAPLLIDINNPSDLTGPLAQFQAKMPTKDGFKELAYAVNKAMPEEKKRAESLLDDSLEVYWPRLEEKLKAIKVEEPDKTPRTRQPEELLEEILLRVRNLERQPNLTSKVDWTQTRQRESEKPPVEDQGLPDLGAVVDLLRQVVPPRLLEDASIESFRTALKITTARTLPKTVRDLLYVDLSLMGFDPVELEVGDPRA